MERDFDEEFHEITKRLEKAEERAAKAEAQLNAIHAAVPMVLQMDDTSDFWGMVEFCLKNPGPSATPNWTEITDDTELDIEEEY